jgi:predicted DNA-binding transcriptional regulator AlpA
MSTPDAVYLTGPQVDKRYSISAMTRWRWRKDRKLRFPPPLIIKRRCYWSIEALERWEREREAKSAA